MPLSRICCKAYCYGRRFGKGSIAEGDNFVCDGGQAFGAITTHLLNVRFIRIPMEQRI